MNRGHFRRGESFISIAGLAQMIHESNQRHTNRMNLTCLTVATGLGGTGLSLAGLTVGAGITLLGVLSNDAQAINTGKITMEVSGVTLAASGGAVVAGILVR